MSNQLILAKRLVEIRIDRNVTVTHFLTNAGLVRNKLKQSTDFPPKISLTFVVETSESLKYMTVQCQHLSVGLR